MYLGMEDDFEVLGDCRSIKRNERRDWYDRIRIRRLMKHPLNLVHINPGCCVTSMKLGT
jgi:hypothetical protein